MLNYLTLKISNKEVARNLDLHQAQKIDRLLSASIIGGSIYMISSIIDAWLFKSGPWVGALNILCFLPFVTSFRIFRIYRKEHTVFCEYFVILIFAVGVFWCTLSNTNLLPEKLSGPGIDDFRQLFAAEFFIISILSALSLQNVILIFSPLYLVGQFFYYK